MPKKVKKSSRLPCSSKHVRQATNKQAEVMYCIVLRLVIYTDWQKKRYNKNQSCFIQAVISSNYVEN